MQRSRRLVVFVLAATLLRPALAAADWEAAMNAGHAAFAGEEPEQAEALYQAALTEAESVDPDHWKVRQTLIHLARFYLSQGRPDAAVPVLERRVGLEERTLGASHPDLIVALETLAQAYEGVGDSAAAERQRARARAIRESALATHEASVVPDFSWVPPIRVPQEDRRVDELYDRARSLHEPREPEVQPQRAEGEPTLPAPAAEDAEATLLAALGELESSLGPTDPQLVPTLLELGRYYVNQGQLDYAFPTFTRAVSILDQAPSADVPVVLGVLEYGAQVAAAIGQHDTAMQYYRRGLALSEEHYGPHDPELLDLLEGAAQSANRLGRTAEAEEFLRRALDLAERAGGPDEQATIRILRQLGRLYLQQRRYADAEQIYDEALLRRERAGAAPALLAEALSDLGEVYAETGRFDEAQAAYARALDLRGNRIEDHERGNAGAAERSLTDVGTLAMNEGRYDDAIDLYQRALAAQEGSAGTGKDTDAIAMTLDHLARAYAMRHRYAESAAAFKRALDHWERVIGSNNLQLAVHFHHLAYLYFIQGRYADAEPPLQHAIQILEQAAGPEHPDVLTWQIHQAEVLDGLGRPDAAATLRARVAALERAANARTE